ncbi:hypothetical protein C8Q76DRAFT_799000 [Earliella scabrosa]|nr:hypothetical protein C8Q76DRAFT_799000 [Earliella scabrosa]
MDRATKHTSLPLSSTLDAPTRKPAAPGRVSSEPPSAPRSPSPPEPDIRSTRPPSPPPPATANQLFTRCSLPVAPRPRLENPRWLGYAYILPPHDEVAYCSMTYGFLNPINPTYSHPIADLTKYFPLGSVSFVIHFGETGALLPSPLQIHYCPSAFHERTPVNKAISVMVRHLPRAYTDFSLSDIAHIRAFFACAA